MAERYTRSEVERIVGVSPRQLHYWQRLRLVRPRTRWGERFYSFSDLVALGAIKRLTDERVPAGRLGRAIEALEWQFGEEHVPFDKLKVLSHGKQLAVIPPGPDSRPFDPLTGQLWLRFEIATPESKIHHMTSRTAEQWFEFALTCDAQPDTITEAAAAYRRVIELAPGWVEAHINLGVVLYQLAELDGARQSFESALAIDLSSAIAHFNLGCVLEEMGNREESIEHLTRAVELEPSHSDAHFNLALAFEKNRDTRRAREHWTLYLRYEPSGTWSDYARSRLVPAQTSQTARARRAVSAPIPFPTRN
ncbi:MAG: tetratricopeptide repeat protein [Candidatus Acidiferrales bacterium]